MKKKFAEDDLLGRFRLKNNHALRIDLRPTPPEKVEEVIKEMEPLIENLGTSPQSTSGLRIDWDTNEIEIPDNMPSDDELKAILFRDPKDDVPHEQNDIFKSQRHQKMLELLAKVEALSQVAAKEETQINEMPSKLPEDHLVDDSKASEIEGSLFNGEEAEMRSDTEKFQSLPSKQTASEPRASVTETKITPALEKAFKLNVDQEDFQERLIRILNENYSEMGEIRPHNLKSRLIEILNEEYADEYSDDEEDDDFDVADVDEADSDGDESDETDSDAANLEAEVSEEADFNEAFSDNALLDEADSGERKAYEKASYHEDSDDENLEDENIDDEDSDHEYTEENEVYEEVLNAFIKGLDEEKTSETVAEFTPVEAPELERDFIEEFVAKSESETIIERDSFGAPESDSGAQTENETFEKRDIDSDESEYPTVRKNRERFSHFQYVTSFQEVTDAESEPEESTELADEDLTSESGSAWEPQKAKDEEINPSMALTPEPETLPESEGPSAEEDTLNVYPKAELKYDEHLWLNELREEGDTEDMNFEASQPRPAPEHKWASSAVFGASDPTKGQERIQERGWERDHRQQEEKVSQEERLFGTEAAETAKSEKTEPEKHAVQNSERYMSVEEWSFVFDTLKEQIDYLRKQLEIKDHQLQNKDELIRNFQILLKNEQDKFLKLENKMEDVVLQVEERAAKKGFFSRFRKR